MKHKYEPFVRGILSLPQGHWVLLQPKLGMGLGCANAPAGTYSRRVLARGGCSPCSGSDGCCIGDGKGFYPLDTLIWSRGGICLSPLQGHGIYPGSLECIFAAGTLALQPLRQQDAGHHGPPAFPTAGLAAMSGAMSGMTIILLRGWTVGWFGPGGSYLRQGLDWM